MRVELILCGGEPYVATELEDERGWFVWRLKLNSNVYHVGAHGCTCPLRGNCKHTKGLAELLTAKPAEPTKQLERKDPRHSRG